PTGARRRRPASDARSPWPQPSSTSPTVSTPGPTTAGRPSPDQADAAVVVVVAEEAGGAVVVVADGAAACGGVEAGMPSVLSMSAAIARASSYLASQSARLPFDLASLAAASAMRSRSNNCWSCGVFVADGWSC